MEAQLDLPKQFNITYDEPKFNRHIKFSIYREPELLTWNGYYQECRIRLWNTGEYWVVAGYIDGIQGCYFRSMPAAPNLEVIRKLIQCACYFIDINKEKKEEQ
jgi:hypothetical protein